MFKTLPKQDLIELNTQITANRLMTNGIDPNALQNANQVENALNQIEAMEKANLARNIRGGINETRTAKVMDMEGQEIPPGSRIMGGKEVKETEAEIAARIQEENKKGIEGLKQKMAKEKARTQRISGNLRADNLQRYDIGKPKLDEDEYDYYREILDDDENFVVKGDETKEQLEAMVKEQEAEMAYMKRLYDKGALDDPEKKANGGRAGYKTGLGPGFKKLLQSMSDNSPVQAYKKYLESVKNRAQTDPKQLAPELGAVAASGIFVNRRMSDILEGMNEKQKEKYLEEFKKELDNDPFYKKRPELKDKIIESYIESEFGEKKADGGRIGLFLGGSSKGTGLARALMRYFSGESKSGKKGSEIMKMMNPKSYQKLLDDPAIYTKFNVKEGLGAPDMIKNMQREASKDRLNMIKDFIGTAKRIKKADDDLIKYKEEVKEGLMKNVGLSEEEAEIAAQRLSRMAEDMAGQTSRRTPKVTEEGILGLENILKNMETGGKKSRELNAVGGRIGYKVGSIDKARRAFLKLLGAGAATTAAIKSGIIGLGKKGKVAKEIVKTKPVAGKPEWFDSLVNKVITEGEDVTKQMATLDRQSVHRYKIDADETVDVTQDLTTGDVKVSYNSPNNMAGESVELNYKAPEILEDGKTVPADFNATEVEPRGIRMGPDDYEIEFDGENMVDNVDDLMSDTTKLKSLAGKNPTMKEIVEGTKKKKKVEAINEDTMEQAEYLETKYGPGDEGDPNFQDFSDYASGGIARMLGE